MNRGRQAEIVEVIARQVGRYPTIAFQETVQCPFGWPAVLTNAPFSPQGEPNPNLHYLSCPHLARHLSRLEDCGGIRRLEQAVRCDSVLRADLEAAQRLHASSWARAAGGFPFPNLIAPPHIAATKSQLLLKCLHAHYAFYLVYPRYALGRLIEQEIGEEWCHDERCAALFSE